MSELTHERLIAHQKLRDEIEEQAGWAMMAHWPDGGHRGLHVSDVIVDTNGNTVQVNCDDVWDGRNATSFTVTAEKFLAAKPPTP